MIGWPEDASEGASMTPDIDVHLPAPMNAEVVAVVATVATEIAVAAAAELWIASAAAAGAEAAFAAVPEL